MAENKTKPTDRKVEEFLASVEDETKRQDCFTLIQVMQEVTGEPPVMWGDTMVGFGSYHYKYASGREGDAMLVGFSPRKQNLTVYILAGFEEYEPLLKKLGKHKLGKACLYLNKLKDSTTRAATSSSPSATRPFRLPNGSKASRPSVTSIWTASTPAAPLSLATPIARGCIRSAACATCSGTCLHWAGGRGIRTEM
ncbi:MAG: DUF1801 domain-containing protein [Chloroflexi bacterium]|nr:DUF1801 domain-containing protein [Chloroflexota bacterium]